MTMMLAENQSQKEKDAELGAVTLPLPAGPLSVIDRLKGEQENVESSTDTTISLNNPFKGGRDAHAEIRIAIMEKLRQVPGAGLLMALVCSICFATAGFMVGLMRHVGDGKGVDAAFVVICRSVIQLVFFLPAALYFRDPILGVKGERSFLFQRAIFGFIAWTLLYYTLSFVSLSDSSAIAFSAPVYVSIFARFLLNEPCGPFQVVTIAVTLIGVMLVARPSFLSFVFDIEGENKHDVFTPEKRMIGVSLAFITSLCMSYTFITMRRLQKTPTTSVIIVLSLFCIVAGVIILGILHLVFGDSWTINLPSHPLHWLFLLMNGLCGVLGHTLLVLALKVEKAGLVSLLRTFDIVMAFGYQIAFLNQPIYMTSILGAIIICSGCAAVAVKKLVDSSNLDEVWEKFSNIISSRTTSSRGSQDGQSSRRSSVSGNTDSFEKSSIQDLSGTLPDDMATQDKELGVLQKLPES